MTHLVTWSNSSSGRRRSGVLRTHSRGRPWRCAAWRYLPAQMGHADVGGVGDDIGDECLWDLAFERGQPPTCPIPSIRQVAPGSSLPAPCAAPSTLMIHLALPPPTGTASPAAATSPGGRLTATHSPSASPATGTPAGRLRQHLGGLLGRAPGPGVGLGQSAGHPANMPSASRLMAANRTTTPPPARPARRRGPARQPVRPGRPRPGPPRLLPLHLEQVYDTFGQRQVLLARAPGRPAPLSSESLGSLWSSWLAIEWPGRVLALATSAALRRCWTPLRHRPCGCVRRC